MARQLRITFENAFYHVMARGIRKECIFPDDYHKFKFLEYLEKNLLKYGVVCYSYCIMDNHFHLYIRTTEPNLPDFMKTLNNSYANWYVKKHGCCGAVFSGRYKSILVESDSYSLTLVNYIHQNPFKKMEILDAVNYNFSSLRYYLGLSAKPFQNLDREMILGSIASNVDEAVKAYSVSLYKNISDNYLKRMTYKKTILGGKEFIEEIEKKLGPDFDKTSYSYDVIDKPRSYQQILNWVIELSGVSKNVILSKRNNNYLRLIAIKLISENTRLKNKDVGKIFNIKGNTVTGNIKNINRILENDPKINRLYGEILEKINKK